MTPEYIIAKHSEVTGKIVDVITKNIPDAYAILYIGSWARKEMSYTYENGNINFLNDIDVLIITKEKIDRDNIKFLRDETSKAINDNYFSYEEYVATEGVHNFYVDIRNNCIQDLKDIIPRMKYYDIFSEPHPIYLKNKDIIKFFPKIELDDIPLQDGLVHLFNRMALLIEWNPELVKKNKILLILVLKAYSAVLDALLLLNKKYAVSLREKANVFKANYETDFHELWKKLPDLSYRIDLMVDMKINYHSYHEKIDEENILNIWCEAKRDIIIVTIYIINSIFKTDFELSIDEKNISNVVNFLKDKNGFAINPYVEEYSKKKFGYGPGFFINFIYYIIRYRYFSKFNGISVSSKNRNIVYKTISNTQEPTSQLYLAILALLGGINYTPKGKVYDQDLVNISDDHLSNISLDMDIYPDVMDKFREIFRTWELFTFEQ